jgi:hypothetical protein
LQMTFVPDAGVAFNSTVFSSLILIFFQ